MTISKNAVNEALTVVSPQSAPNESTGYTNSMSRDELRQPLRKRSLNERLWARRPSPLLSTSLFAASGFIALSAWAIYTPLPFAGEPIVTATIPAVEELKTASTTAPEEEQAVEEEA